MVFPSRGGSSTAAPLRRGFFSPAGAKQPRTRQRSSSWSLYGKPPCENRRSNTSMSARHVRLRSWSTLSRRSKIVPIVRASIELRGARSATRLSAAVSDSAEAFLKRVRQRLELGIRRCEARIVGGRATSAFTAISEIPLYGSRAAAISCCGEASGRKHSSISATTRGWVSRTPHCQSGHGRETRQVRALWSDRRGQAPVRNRRGETHPCACRLATRSGAV
jgi:hypothetical protein